MNNLLPVCVDLLILPDDYPEEFKTFCLLNNLNPPKITSKNGQALRAMLANPMLYWTRKEADLFCKKYNIETSDSIQLFNKHSQWGIKTNSDLHIKGRNFIVFPYELSNKRDMRKHFQFKGDKAEAIQKIKNNIINDYINVPEHLWQLGHRNPGSTDNTQYNLVLQPPIQGRYRDDYVFFDTLTKFPLPHKLKTLDLNLTKEQVIEYAQFFSNLSKQME